jgi:hypothetical protein
MPDFRCCALSLQALTRNLNIIKMRLRVKARNDRE